MIANSCYKNQRESTRFKSSSRTVFLSPQLGEIPTIRKKLIITELTCEVFVNLIIIIKANIVCLTETYLSRDAPIGVNGY